MANPGPIASIDKRPETRNKLNKRSKANAFRTVQVLPPHRVDLTLHPTTQEQMSIPPKINRKN
ncbi:hypothetical protein RGCCGE502_09440 [Rhizobium grahamii CCGE 502]|uniref:Uncharacterized protein n=1 Tax=Rhizobium grahamii CCGE 502 TaxID=990285 RepID=S3HIR4_9HYPH|nr:hypothetical protein RGCCGE502_09440 [Rhizobium grahamii CCGE 502]